MAVAVAEEVAAVVGVAARHLHASRLRIEKLQLGRRRAQRRLLTEQAEEEGERRRRQRCVVRREEVEQECAEVRFAGEGQRVVAGCAVGARGGERRRRRRVEQFAAARRLDGAFPRGEQFTQLLVAMLFDQH